MPLLLIQRPARHSKENMGKPVEALANVHGDKVTRRDFLNLSWLASLGFAVLPISDSVNRRFAGAGYPASSVGGPDNAAAAAAATSVSSGTEQGEVPLDSPELQWLKGSTTYRRFYPEGPFSVNFAILPSGADGDSRITYTDTIVAATITTQANENRPAQKFLIVRGKQETVTDLLLLSKQIIALSKYTETTVSPLQPTEIVRILTVYYLANKKPLLNLVDYPHADVQVMSPNNPSALIAISSPTSEELFPLTDSLDDSGELISFVTELPFEIIVEVKDSKVLIPVTVQNAEPTTRMAEIEVDKLLHLIDACTLLKSAAQNQNSFQTQDATALSWGTFQPYAIENADQATAEAQKNDSSTTQSATQPSAEGGSNKTGPGCGFGIGERIVRSLGKSNPKLYSELIGELPHRYAAGITRTKKLL